MKNRQNKIEHIMDNFQFYLVQRAMKALDWMWWDSSETPSIERLRSTARDLLERVCKGDCINLSTGGFVARRSGEHLFLSFEVEDWDTLDAIL